VNFLICQKRCYKSLEAILTEPSKINQFAVLTFLDFKLNKAKGFCVLSFILTQIVMMNFSKGAFLLFAIPAIVAGCRNKERPHKETNFNQLYFDYSVSAEEGDENVTCVFQYKYGGEEGRPVNIEPAKVSMDGQPIETDSAKLSGFFYEVQRPIDSFTGKHLVVFTTPEEKEYRNEFEFSPFTIRNELPQKMRRKPFDIQLNNFPTNGKSIRLLLLDTAFESSGFNDRVPVVDGKINIDERILRTVKNGPVVLELYNEEELPLKQKNEVGGKISVTYALRREFNLSQ
jgi:hypothetical protein